ncbi:tripartite motif-containing 13 isoform X1 [Lepisosteus oculatus]|uniref:tripartite motif-containing 13 isoform X1 n=1 Tax=Lepisosteus oculatus TaxID=7918 RepID=UPI0035F50548
MELLEEDLTCPICCCLFEDPRVLPCSHNFCKKCLEGILEGSRSPSWRPPFRCPTCRKETYHSGINSLQTNYSLRGIVEKYHKIKLTPKMYLCKTHGDQPLNIFCSTDLRLICGFCATMGEHKGHKFCALRDAYLREKAAFEALFRVLEDWRSADVLSCLECLETSKKKALHLVSSDAEKATHYFDKLMRTLEQKKNEILSDFETLKLAVMQTYDPEINKLCTVLEEQKRALSIAESFRDQSDPLFFLQQMQELREKLGIIRDTTLPSRADMDVSPLMRSFDIRQWDSVKLKDIDKLCAPHETSSPSCTKPRYYKGFLAGAASLFFSVLLALHFLGSANVAFIATHALTTAYSYLPVAAEHAVLFRDEVASLCLLLFELCQKSFWMLLNLTGEFICTYKLL